MTRIKEALEDGPREDLYQRDYFLWVEEQVRLLRAGRLTHLDVLNLIDEVEDLGRSLKSALTSNLFVVLKHLLKHQFQPRRRSRSWLSSIAEHRRRLRNDLRGSPSLRGYARQRFAECYGDAREQARIETGLPAGAFPIEPPFDLNQALDPDFLPD